MQTATKDKRPQLKSRLNEIKIGDLIDTGANITSSQDSWNSTWPLQKGFYMVARKWTLSQLNQSLKWIRCIGIKGQVEKLEPE